MKLLSHADVTAHIGICRDMQDSAEALYALSGCFAHKGTADGWALALVEAERVLAQIPKEAANA
jgi:hypothetical protein